MPHKAFQKSHSEPGIQSGLKPPLATTSGTAKLWRPRKLMCSQMSCHAGATLGAWTLNSIARSCATGVPNRRLMLPLPAVQAGGRGVSA